MTELTTTTRSLDDEEHGCCYELEIAERIERERPYWHDGLYVPEQVSVERDFVILEVITEHGSREPRECDYERVRELLE